MNPGFLGCASKTTFKLLSRYEKHWRHTPIPAQFHKEQTGVQHELYQLTGLSCMVFGLFCDF